MSIAAFFTKEGKPKEGLTPTIKILDVEEASFLIEEDEMTDIGSGFYKYNYELNKDKEYVVLCDGGEELREGERYCIARNDYPMVFEIRREMERKGGILETIMQIEKGRWKIEENQMIFFEEDNETEIMRFNLFDHKGQPSMEHVFDRVKS